MRELPGRGAEEKRRVRRVSLLNEISYRAGDQITRKRLVDLSVEGIFIDTSDPLPVGADLTLDFTLPNKRRIHVRGRVRYHHAGVGMGIQFTDLPEADQKAIEEFVTRIG